MATNPMLQAVLLFQHHQTTTPFMPPPPPVPGAQAMAKPAPAVVAAFLEAAVGVAAVGVVAVGVAAVGVAVGEEAAVAVASCPLATWSAPGRWSATYPSRLWPPSPGRTVSSRAVSSAGSRPTRSPGKWAQSWEPSRSARSRRADWEA